MRSDRGSVTIEVVLLTPVIVVMFQFVVYVSRLVASQHIVQLAADRGARSASLVRYSRMQPIGVESAHGYLETRRSSCTNTRVNVAVDRDSDRPSVLVEIECEVDTAGLGLLGVLPKTVRASSLEVIDLWRADE